MQDDRRCTFRSQKKQTIRMPWNSMFAMGMELDLKNIPTVDLTYQNYKRPR